jgi:hypothetical protein
MGERYVFDMEDECEQELLLLLERESPLSEEDVEFGGDGGFKLVDST